MSMFEFRPDFFLKNGNVHVELNEIYINLDKICAVLICKDEKKRKWYCSKIDNEKDVYKMEIHCSAQEGYVGYFYSKDQANYTLKQILKILGDKYI